MNTIDTTALIVYSIISLACLLFGFQMVFRKKATDRAFGWFFIVAGAFMAALIGVSLYFIGF